ncbi:protein SRC2-like [Carex rostrata]
MGRRRLDIVLISAESLRRQKPDTPMVVYAQAYITKHSRPVQLQPTTADPVGDVNPKWNYALSFNLRCSSGGSRSPESLIIELMTKIPDEESLMIGRSEIPLVSFLASAGKRETSMVNYSCPVSTGGCLNFSYKLGDYRSTAARICRKAALIALDVTLESTVGIGGISDLFEGQ